MPKSTIETEQVEPLVVSGARVHNLKNIDVTIPREKFVVITGLSGSGKSSLAFDTIYAEGQRRYIESFASYARQFLGNLERPDVEQITGLSPVISIEQKTVSKNPRSTVGTITEVYDFLRLLFSKVSDAYSYNTGDKMVKYSQNEIVDLISNDYNNQAISILAPIIKGRKGHYRELFRQIVKMGFLRVRVDGEVKEITNTMQLDRYKVHDIEIVIDRLEIKKENRKRLDESVATAMKHGKNSILILPKGDEEPRHFSKNLMCPATGISYDEPAPNFFSFNSPYGACENCGGLGKVSEIDLDKIIPSDKKSIKQGAFEPLGKYTDKWIFKQLEAIGRKYDFKITTPVNEISDEAMRIILYGTSAPLKMEDSIAGVNNSYSFEFEGIVNFISRQFDDNPSSLITNWAVKFMNKIDCPECNGNRLKKEAYYFKINEFNIADVSNMSIEDLSIWMLSIDKKLTKKNQVIAKDILKEINTRLQFLLDVGLNYLSLNRPSKSLSGGEAQRIRLATQIGSQLVGVLYILDEPSIGLHQRDNIRLINSLKDLRDLGNSIIVVEHDKEIMLAADHLIDIGPRAGVNGGQIIGEDSPANFLKNNTTTAKYLNGELEIPFSKDRRKGNGKKLVLKGATGNNLKSVDISLPLGQFICVSGVSGSGKSTLINETLFPILSQHFYKSRKSPLPYQKITGLEHIDKVIDIDQSPIGRTPRSNPATYTGVFTDIRALFSELPEAKIRGYKQGRFSFNVSGGRCNTCKGAGLQTVEMNFLPDVYVECSECHGKRYNRETLEIRYKGKSISDVLNLTINEAVDYFSHIPSILNKIQTLKDVGLGYIRLGQASTTLSGGEAQRVKLATELSKKNTGNTFYILDEPSTGLHFEDIRILLEVLNKIVDAGNTVLVIEHNLDIIKVADYIIDIGPEGGDKGGKVIVEGTPEQVSRSKTSHTAPFLLEELKSKS
jgi:excinuclease ABC subunit A